MSFLLDTNVVSEIRKGQRCDSGVASWFGNIPAENIFLSALTLGELRKGIESLQRRDPVGARSLDRWYTALSTAHADRILSVDQTIAEEWGRLCVPNSLPVIDGLIAATASVHGLTVVSRNLRDIEPSGVPCLNPFSV